MTIRTSDRSTSARNIFIATICAILAARLTLSLSLPYDRLAGLFDDDAYYYFKIASRIARGEGSTFDGINRTNGYHPLWMALLVPIFRVTDGRSSLVAVVLASSVLFALLGWVLWTLSRFFPSRTLALAAACPLLIVCSAGPSFSFSGMETSLLLVLLAVFSCRLLAADEQGWDDVPNREYILLGLIAAGIILARLDAALLVGLGLLLLVVARRLSFRALAILATPIFISLALYVLINLVYFGTLLPVSGQAKSLGENQGRFATITQYLQGPAVLGVPTFFGLVSLAVVALQFARSRITKSGYQLLDWIGTAIAVGGLLIATYFALTSSWRLWPWYFWAPALSLFFTLPSVVPAARFRTDRLFLIAGTALTVLVVLATTIRTVTMPVTRASYVENGPRLAAAIDRIEPRGMALALGDRAGSIAFHLARPVVQLEGLVTSVEYLRELESGDVSPYLRSSNVGLYARFDDVRSVLPDTASCTAYSEPTQGDGPKIRIETCASDLVFSEMQSDGTLLRVWRYNRQIQPRG